MWQFGRKLWISYFFILSSIGSSPLLAADAEPNPARISRMVHIQCKQTLSQLGLKDIEPLPKPNLTVIQANEDLKSTLRNHLFRLLFQPPKESQTSSFQGVKFFDSNRSGSMTRALALQLANEIYRRADDEFEEPRSILSWGTQNTGLAETELRQLAQLEAANHRLDKDFLKPNLPKEKFSWNFKMIGYPVLAWGLMTGTVFLSTKLIPFIHPMQMSPERWLSLYQSLPSYISDHPYLMALMYSAKIATVPIWGFGVYHSSKFLYAKFLKKIYETKLARGEARMSSDLVPAMNKMADRIKEMDSKQESGVLWLSFRGDSISFRPLTSESNAKQETQFQFGSKRRFERDGVRIPVGLDFIYLRSGGDSHFHMITQRFDGRILLDGRYLLEWWAPTPEKAPEKVKAAP